MYPVQRIIKLYYLRHVSIVHSTLTDQPPIFQQMADEAMQGKTVCQAAELSSEKRIIGAMLMPENKCGTKLGVIVSGAYAEFVQVLGEGAVILLFREATIVPMERRSIDIGSCFRHNSFCTGQQVLLVITLSAELAAFTLCPILYTFCLFCAKMSVAVCRQVFRAYCTLQKPVHLSCFVICEPCRHASRTAGTMVD